MHASPCRPHATGPAPQSDRIDSGLLLDFANRHKHGVALGALGDAAGSVKERAEIAGNDMEADLSLVKYIAWAIPALGFIGTVRGIGEALSQAEKAISGDLTGVVDALGLAFNSTLVALLLSMVLMFLLHLLQGRQDKLILDLQNYCDEHVVAQMKVPAQETSTPAFQA